MFECPLCEAQYGDATSAEYCRQECLDAERESRITQVQRSRDLGDDLSPWARPLTPH